MKHSLKVLEWLEHCIGITRRFHDYLMKHPVGNKYELRKFLDKYS